MSDAQRHHDALTVRGLTVSYRGGVALDAVDLDVPPGGRVAVVGRNGAGKSSLVRAIAGVVPPANGAVTWAGEDITRLQPGMRVRRGITLVPEGRHVFPDMTVADNLRVGGFVLPMSELPSRRDYVYGIFPRLSERARLPASQLSGGEAQMLAIGQALMAHPRLIMLDEPSFGLAPVMITRVLETIRELSSLGISVLLVEQSVRLALALADQVYVLDRGKLEKAGDSSTGIDQDALHTAYLGTAVER